VSKRRPGIKVLEDVPGTGESVERQKWYRMSLRIWLRRGDPVAFDGVWGLADRAELSPDRYTMTADFRLDREFLFGGLFYGVEGMRIGGRRLLEIAPHLAFRDQGVPDIIPPNAVLTVEVIVHEERQWD
jgi:hypothetical protein